MNDEINLLSRNPVQQVLMQQLHTKFMNQHDGVTDVANWVAALRKLAMYIEAKETDLYKKADMCATPYFEGAMKDWRDFSKPEYHTKIMGLDLGLSFEELKMLQ